MLNIMPKYINVNPSAMLSGSVRKAAQMVRLARKMPVSNSLISRDITNINTQARVFTESRVYPNHCVTGTYKMSPEGDSLTIVEKKVTTADGREEYLSKFENGRFSHQKTSIINPETDEHAAANFAEKQPKSSFSVVKEIQRNPETGVLEQVG